MRFSSRCAALAFPAAGGFLVTGGFLLSACGGGRAAGDGSGTGAVAPASAQHADSAALELLPAGFGTLRQEDISLRLQMRGLQVHAFPLEEAIIRTLAPDAYRSVHDLVASRRSEVEIIARRHGIRRPVLWMVSFFGLEQDVRFSPMEVTITSQGRTHRPVELIPLSAGFGEQRLNVRETRRAIYVFSDELNVEQPLVLSLESASALGWDQVLRRIEREKALIRSRAGVSRSEPSRGRPWRPAAEFRM